MQPPLEQKTLILIRHAESKLNAARKEYLHAPWHLFRDGFSNCIDPGVKDAPLTNQGQQQAQAAGRRLARDVARGHLPRIQVLGISPLRRTLHTGRLVADTADVEIAKLAGCTTTEPSWWSTPPKSSYNVSIGATPSTCDTLDEDDKTPPRRIVIIPSLRERRTTLADQPSVRPAKAMEYWQTGDAQVTLASPMASSPLRVRPNTHARVGHFLTVGITQPCRKVEVESVESVARRIEMLERWVESRPEDVIMLVGHNMIFKAWQKYWMLTPRERGPVWAPRELIVKHMTQDIRRGHMRGFLGLCDTCCDYEEAGRMSGMNFVDVLTELGSKGLGRSVHECANTEMLIVKWRPTLDSMARRGRLGA